MFMGETQTMRFVSSAMQVHGGQCATLHSDKKKKQVCATTVPEKMWCAVGVSVYTFRFPATQSPPRQRHGIVNGATECSIQRHGGTCIFTKLPLLRQVSTRLFRPATRRIGDGLKLL